MIGDPHRKFFFNGMRMLFARLCKTCWLQLHNMNNVTEQDCRRFMARVSQQLRKAPV